MKICEKCETVAHCTKHGCTPFNVFWPTTKRVLSESTSDTMKSKDFVGEVDNSKESL